MVQNEMSVPNPGVKQKNQKKNGSVNGLLLKAHEVMFMSAR